MHHGLSYPTHKHTYTHIPRSHRRLHEIVASSLRHHVVMCHAPCTHPLFSFDQHQLVYTPSLQLFALIYLPLTVANPNPNHSYSPHVLHLNPTPNSELGGGGAGVISQIGFVSPSSTALPLLKLPPDPSTKLTPTLTPTLTTSQTLTLTQP